MLKGRIVSFVVRLMMSHPDGTEANVARYDTAHGTPHLDLLGRRHGLLRKTWYLDTTLDGMLRWAVSDFKRRYEDYIRNYLQN